MTAAVPAVVLGGGITALAVLRELAKTGVPVLAAADGDDLVAASKYFRPLPAGLLAQDEDTIEPYFRSLELERAALFLAATSGRVQSRASPLISRNASRPSLLRPHWSSSLPIRAGSWISSSARESRTPAQRRWKTPGTWRRSPTPS
jgi:hypothetical protein